MRRQRQRDRGESFFEHNAVTGDSVEGGSVEPGEAVDRQPVGPHGIERNQEDITRALGTAAPGMRHRNHQQHHCQRQGDGVAPPDHR